MGTRIPLLCTYQALTLRLYGPLNIQVTGHPVGTSCFQFVRTRVGLLCFYCSFFFFLFKHSPKNLYYILLRQPLGKLAYIVSFMIDSSDLLAFISSVTMVMNYSCGIFLVSVSVSTVVETDPSKMS